MSESLKPVGEFEELPEKIVAQIMVNGWPAIVGEIDRAFGCAPVLIDSADLKSKAVWTTDGKRITVSMGGGGFMLSQTRDPDPLYAQRRMRAHVEQAHPGTLYSPECDECVVIDALLSKIVGLPQ